MAGNVVELLRPDRGAQGTLNQSTEQDDLNVMLMEIRSLKRIAESIEAKLEVRVNRYVLHLQQGGQRIS